MKLKKKSAHHTKRIKFRIFSLFFLLSLAVGVILLVKPNHTCANSISCIKDLSGQYDLTSTVGEFMGQVVSPPTLATNDITTTSVLGTSTASQKRIEVDLTNQKLYAYDNGSLLYEFPVSTGKWGRTPTGEFLTWIKLRYTRMTGGNKAIGTFYDLPNVPYTMFFYNDKIPKSMGYGIHGAYWHNNFGHPMSHGCVNMKIEDAEKLYNWASPPSTANTVFATADNPGTKVIIYGTAPLE